MSTPIGSRVWSYGKVLLLAGTLAATFFVFAGIAMRVAVRARQVTVPDLVGKSIADATTIAAGLDLPERGFRRQDVFAWLASAPLLRDGRWAPTQSWERLSREAGVVAGRSD